MDLIFRNRYKHIVDSIDQYPQENAWIRLSQEAKMGIKYVCYAGSTGYADASRGYVRSLYEVGVPVNIEVYQYYNGKTQLSVQDNVIAISLQNTHLDYDTVIIHTVPNTWSKIVEQERKHRPNCRIYGLTVWETDTVYPEWVDIIAKLDLTGLILPSEWNGHIFSKNHHMPPIYVCHHAISLCQNRSEGKLETVLYKGSPKTLKLLCIGTWTCRKGIDETVHAYLKTFTKHDDVILYLKTSDGKYSDKNSFELLKRLHHIVKQYPAPALIQLDTSLRSDDYMELLIDQSDVYISLCNSEGVGLGACYAASQGKIVVMTGYGGQREYIPVANWVDYKLGEVRVPPGFAHWIQPPQKWAYPDLEHAVKILRNIYKNRQEFAKSTPQNRKFIEEHFSYRAIGEKLLGIVGMKPSYQSPECGLWRHRQGEKQI